MIVKSVNEALKGTNDYTDNFNSSSSEEDIRKKELMKDLNSVRWGKLGTGDPNIKNAAQQVAKKWGLTVRECNMIFFGSQYTGDNDKTLQSLIDKAIHNRSHSLWGGSHKSNPMGWLDKFAGSPEAKQMAKQLNPSGDLPNLKKSMGLNESRLKEMVSKAVRKSLKEGIDSQEERINAAVEALMSVREIVSRASDCWEYEDVNAPLFQQICAASSAIEGVMGFSRYGDERRRQAGIEQSEQD